MIEFISPRTGAPLYREDAALVSGDGEYFPVVRGIPRFVSSESYATSFGLEWVAHERTQLDSHTGAHLSQVRLERCMGAPLTTLAGKTVLDAGCGAGRFTELLVRAGALVHAIDLSAAVDANRRNIGERANYIVAQADILDPPFPRESFDVVICLGVLQHTPSPEASIRSLWLLLKPGGTLVFDHYAWNLSAVTKLAPVYRIALRRLPPATAKRVTDRLVDVFFPLHWRARRVRIAQMLLSRVSPCLAYCHAYPQLTKEQHRDWCRLDTFDQLTDRYKHRRTTRQIRRVLASIGAHGVHVVRSCTGSVVEARCSKPAYGTLSALADVPSIHAASL